MLGALSLLLVTGTLAGSGGRASADPILKWERTVGIVRESSPLPVSLGAGTDVVVGSLDGNLVALRSTDGSPARGWPQATGSPINASPSAADTDGDGRPELFIGSGTDYGQNGALSSYTTDGGRRFRLELVDESGSRLSVRASPAIGDINRDSVPDVTFGALGLTLWSVDAGGRRNRGWPLRVDETVFSSAALADVNGDGQTDAVVGIDSTAGGPIDFDGGMVWAISGDGTVLWEYRTDEQMRSSPSIGDVDGDGRPEIVFGTGEYWAKKGSTQDSTTLFVLNTDGTLQWRRDLGARTLASPALADVNGDGRLDIATGTWEGVDPGKVWALNGDGANLAGYPRPSGGGIVIGGIVTADINGDGAQDLLVPTGGGVFGYDGRNGKPLLALDQGKVAFQNSPLVADLDGNGLIDVVVAGERASDNTGYVARYELPPPARAGDLGWPMFRKDARRTGSWTNPPLSQPSRSPPTAPLPPPPSPPPGRPVIALSVPAVDFGGVAVGGGPVPREVKVKNTGTADLKIGEVFLEGDGDFTKGADGCSGKTLTPNQDGCAIALGFRPTAADARRARLVVPSDASNNSEGRSSVELAGSGTAVPLPPPDLRLDPASVRAGGRVTAMGTGYKGPVQLYWGAVGPSSEVARVTADAAGSFRVTFDIPANAVDGKQQVSACDEEDRCATATVTLEATPDRAPISHTSGWPALLLAGALIVLLGALATGLARRRGDGGGGNGDTKQTVPGDRGPRPVYVGFSPEASQDVFDTHQTLLPGRPYRFWLEIGFPAVVRLDEDPVSASRSVRLQVALFDFDGELALSDEADLGEVDLGRDGSVRVVRQPGDGSVPRAGGDPEAAAPAGGRRLFFPVRTPDRAGDHRLRCNLYHQHVLLQSRVVYARVDRAGRLRSWMQGLRRGRPARGRAGEAVRAEVDFMLAPLLDPDYLERLTPHDLSVMINANDEDTHGFRLFGDQGFKSTASFDDQELQAFGDKIRRALLMAACGEEDESCPPRIYRYDGPPDRERLAADLALLARWGYRVYDRLVERLRESTPGEDPPDICLARLLRGSKRIQIVNKEGVRHLLPAAVVYDRDLDTTLPQLRPCSAFVRSLDENGDLATSACLTGNCPNDGVLDVVCPSGFWGYRHVLGMPPSVGRGGDAFDVPLEIGSPDDPVVILGMSTDPKLVRRLDHVESLRSLRPELQWRSADSRGEILTLLKSSQPDVVYFYCHGGVDNDVPYLQVGPLDDIPITGDNLRAHKIYWSRSHPLVFINGCHTTVVGPRTPFEMVTAFVERQAAGVIGTEVSVFEPLACSFAEECFRRLLVDGVSIGDAVRGARLALLKAGNPLGLIYLPLITDDARLVRRSATVPLSGPVS